MKTRFQKIAYWTSVSVVGVILGVSLQFARAWSEPAVAPPGGNVGAPISTGPQDQVKQGRFGTNGISASSGYPIGWGGGIHTWDLWADGTVGSANDVVANGSIKARYGSAGIGTDNPIERLDVNGNIRMASGGNFYTNGRMHISGDEILYLLNKNGVTISKAWGGNGNLDVEGRIKAWGGIEFPDGTTMSTSGGQHIQATGYFKNNGNFNYSVGCHSFCAVANTHDCNGCGVAVTPSGPASCPSGKSDWLHIQYVGSSTVYCLDLVN